MTWPPEPLPSVPHTLPQAFARMEGWYVHGTSPNRPQRNNNPGDINFGGFAEGFGAVIEESTHPRFANFPTAQDGWSALIALLTGPSYSSLTIEQAVNRYAPPVENQTNQYISLVCQWSGCQQEDTVESVMNR